MRGYEGHRPTDTPPGFQSRGCSTKPAGRLKTTRPQRPFWVTDDSVPVVTQTYTFFKTHELCPSHGCILVYLYYNSIKLIQKENYP